MQLVTLEEFLKIFEGRGARIAKIYTRTNPELLKKHRETKEPCPFVAGVERRAVRVVQFGTIYGNCVNYQREREHQPLDKCGEVEHFDPSPLWKSKIYPDGAGERDGKYTVRHKGTGRRYFALKAATDEKGHTKVVQDFWFDVATGKPISYESVKPFLKSQSKGSGRQGVEKTIQWRTYEVENVLAVQSGELYMIQHSPQMGVAA